MTISPAATSAVRPTVRAASGVSQVTGGSPPERKMRKTSSSNGRPVWVRKNGTARWVQKSSSSLQYFSCSRV
jgi:hypothetical protein